MVTTYSQQKLESKSFCRYSDIQQRRSLKTQELSFRNSDDEGSPRNFEASKDTNYWKSKYCKKVTFLNYLVGTKNLPFFK